MVVSPGIVGPSSKLATRPNDDCEVGNLLTRESWGQLKSFVSKALSTFFKIIAKKKVDKWKNVCYNIQYIQDKEFK